MKNLIVKYGVVGGTVSITLGLINWFTISQYYGLTASQIVGYLSIIVSLFCVPLGIRFFRDNLNDGYVSFPKAMKVGLGITAIFSLVSFLYSMLFFVIAGEDFDEWQRRGLSQADIEQLERQIAQAPDFVYTPIFQGFMLAVTIFLIGMVINLISSLALKRKL